MYTLSWHSCSGTAASRCVARVSEPRDRMTAHPCRSVYRNVAAGVSITRRARLAPRAEAAGAPPAPAPQRAPSRALAPADKDSHVKQLLTELGARLCAHAAWWRGGPRAVPQPGLGSALKGAGARASRARPPPSSFPHPTPSPRTPDKPKGERRLMVIQTAPAVRVAIAETLGLAPGEVSTGQLVAGLRRLGFDYVFGESAPHAVRLHCKLHSLMHAAMGSCLLLRQGPGGRGCATDDTAAAPFTSARGPC